MTAPKLDPESPSLPGAPGPQPSRAESHGHANLLTKAVALVVLSAWTLLGLFFYVPLLARSIAAYSVALAAVSFGRGSIAPAQGALEQAIAFYPKGFRVALCILRHPHLDSPASDPQGPTLDIKKLLLESAYAAAFWLLTFTFTLLFW